MQERFCTLPPEEQLENIVQNLSSKSDRHGIDIARLRCEVWSFATCVSPGLYFYIIWEYFDQYRM